MKRIFIELRDDEWEAIKSLYQFVKLKIGVKQTFFNGLFDAIAKETNDEKVLKFLEELKNRIEKG